MRRRNKDSPLAVTDRGDPKYVTTTVMPRKSGAPYVECPNCGEFSYVYKYEWEDAKDLYKFGVDSETHLFICCRCGMRTKMLDWVRLYQETFLARKGYKTPAMIVKETQ